jgi:hypothetical protein
MGNPTLSGKKTIPSPGGRLPNGTIYEQIQVGTTTQYALRTDKGIEIVPFLEVGEHIVYQPFSPCPWMLPGKPIPYGTIEELWKELWQFAYEHIDIEKVELYDVYVGWVLETWIPELFDSTGYLHFNGPRNSGKTRALDVLNYLCFRALESATASGAALFRAMDSFHPTFLLDEFEIYEKQKESKAEVIGIINAGYRRGQVALRIIGMKEGVPQIKGFQLFGPKAISSIEQLPSALASRCIRFPMRKTFRKVRRLIDKVKAQELRSKLLFFRFNHDLDDMITEEGNPIDLPDGRLIEMFYPLDIVAPTEEIRERILKCARDQYNVSIEEDRATKEAEVFNAVLDMLEEQPRLAVPQRDIRVKYNASKADSEKISNQRMTGLLKTLNFRKSWNSEKRHTEAVIDFLHLESRKNIYVVVEEMGRVNKIIESVRLLTEDVQQTLPVQVDQENQEKQQIPGAFSEGEDATGDQPPVSQKSIDSIDSIDSIADASLQDKIEFVYSELSMAQDLMTPHEISEKLGLSVREADKILSLIAREGRAFSPRIGYWKAAST